MEKNIIIREKYLTFIVYETVRKICEYRNLELISGDFLDQAKSDWLDIKKFVNNIQTSKSKCIVVKTQDNDKKRRRFRTTVSQSNKKKQVITYFVLFDIGTVPESTKEMVDLTDKITMDRKKFNMEIIFIYDSDVNIKRNSIKKLEESRSNGTDREGFLYFDYFDYNIFLTNIFDHVLVSPHEIIQQDEEQKILSDIHCKKDQLPKILRIDPICVYLGAEVGDILRVKIPTETCGTRIEYRVVIPFNIFTK